MANKEWFTASELAGLAGMPGTDRVVRIRAEKQDWQARQREKGRVTDNVLTPLKTQTALLLECTLSRYKLGGFTYEFIYEV